MRKSIFAFVVVGVTILAANELKAQKASTNFLLQTAITAVTEAAIDDAVDVPGNIISTDAVHPKALRNFEKRFRTATNVRWMNLKDGYMASFKSNDITHRIYYQPNGNFAGSIKGYGAENLAQQILLMVKELYNEYTISFVNEAALAGTAEPAYIVNLLGKDSELKVVRICNDESDVIFDSTKPESPKRF